MFSRSSQTLKGFSVRILTVVVLSVFVSTWVLAQDKTTARPDRGIQPLGSYAVSDVENVSLSNGNVNLSFPLAALPAIAGGKLSWVLKANYNSKLWNVRRVEHDSASDNAFSPYVVDSPELSDQGGWSIGGKYRIEIRSARYDDYYYLIPPYNQIDYAEYQRLGWGWYKVVLITPDGAEHELRPTDYASYGAQGGYQDFLKGYFSVLPTTSTPIRYSSFDGTFITAQVSGWDNWSLFLSDGTQVTQSTDGIQRIKDNNGNSIKIYSDVNGEHYKDELTGREIKITSSSSGNNGQGQFQVWYQTVGGDWVSIDINMGVTTVKGKVYTVNDWNPTGSEFGGGIVCQRDEIMQDTDVSVVREIVLPQTEPNQARRKYTFSYNSDDTASSTLSMFRETCGQSGTYTRTASKGWGSLSHMETPSGAAVDYKYSLDSTNNISLYEPDDMAAETITEKKITHDNNTVDTWTYSISDMGGSVTNPDGTYATESQYTHSTGMGYGYGKAGLVYRSTSFGQKIERHWTLLKFSGAYDESPGGIISFNPVVDAEYVTLTDANGGNLTMSAKTFQHDYNGNVTQVKEYDWFNPSSVSRDTEGVPTGVPTGATLLRTTDTSYHNSASSDSSSNVYAKRTVTVGTPSILNAVKDTTVGTSQTRISYDSQSYGTAPTLGNVTTVSRFDDQGDTTSTNDRWVTTSSTYDSYGNVLTSTDANGNVTEILYGDLTHVMPTSVTVNPQNGTGAQTTTTTYDFSTGAVTSKTDPNNKVTTIEYTNSLLGGAIDPFGRPGVVYSPAVTINSTSYRQKTTTTYYDTARQVITASDLNTEGDGLLKSRTTADKLGRTVLVEQSEDGTNYTISSQNVYEQAGKYTYQSNPHRSAAATTDGWTRTTRDIAGRVTDVATFTGSTRPAYNTACTTTNNCTGTVTSTYDGIYTTVTDQAGKMRRSKVNAFGQLIRVDEPNSSNSLGGVDTPTQATSYTYDVLGNLTQVSQGTQTRTFTYGSLSRLSSASNPEAVNTSGVQVPTTYQYDPNGNLKLKTDARGVTTTYTYDALNRVTFRDYSDTTPDVTYTYDTLTNNKGRLVSVSSSVSAYNYTGYDALGRVTGSSQVTDGVTYSMPDYKYDLAGNLTSQQYPSGRIVATTYDNAGRLSQVSGQKTGESNKTYISSPTYSAHGAMTEVKVGLHLWEHTIFNARLQPALIGLGTVQNVQNAPDFNRFRVDYAYNTPNQVDNNGNVLQQTISVPDSSGTNLATLSQYYQYDELNRLKVAVELNGSTQNWKQSFIYDRYGNRTFNTGTGETSSNVVGSLLTIDPANNRITANQGYILYDNAGNLTSDFTGHTFGYDAENKQVSYDGGSTSNGTDYKYDGDGRRIKKINGTTQATTVFVYNAMGQMVAEYANTAPDPSSNGGTSYLTSDSLGTPRVITDASGAVTARHDYLPFGEEIAYNLGGRSDTQKYAYGLSLPENIRQKFTQYERDIETGLDYAEARYYSSGQGRFTSVDPLMASGRGVTPQSWNRYTYVLNNPLKLTDPTGTIDNDPNQQEQRLPLPRPIAPPINLPSQSLPTLPTTPSATPSVDDFEIGLPPVLSTGLSIPARVVETAPINETIAPTGIVGVMNYQAVDQRGNPFTRTTSEGERFIAYEQIEVLPESVVDIPSFDLNQVQTGDSDLSPNGEFQDRLRITTGATGIRIPENTDYRARQRIYIVNPETGKRYDVRLNTIRITSSGVTVTDVTNGIPR
jgi:RHS repeat-associated protein